MSSVHLNFTVHFGRYASLLVCCNFFATCSFSQEVSLDPITVTASFIEMRASETGRNITIIDGEKFHDLPVHSLDELLRFVPGVEVQSRGPMGSQSDIVLRGGTYQQVLVILDGMRINDPNTGHFSSYIPVAPAEIERIEILKGASSALYGADAVGGVIQVITKSFAKNTGEAKGDVTASANAGSFGLINGDAGGYYQAKKLQLGGGVLSNFATGIPLRGMKGYFDNHTVSLSAGYRLTDRVRIAYRLAADQRDFAAQNFYTTFLSDTASERVTTLWNQARVDWQGDKQQASFSMALKSVDDHYRFTPSSVPNANRSQLWQMQFRYLKTLSSASSVVTGVNFQNKKIASNDRGHHHLNVISPFIYFSQKIAYGFHVRPSVQGIFIGKQPFELVPQVDLSWRHRMLQLRAGAGKSIRDADFTERYNNYGKTLVASGTIGNPGLKPEHAVSYEFGGDVFLKSMIKISATYFKRNQTDLIDFSRTPYGEMPRKQNLKPDGVYALAKNIARVRTSGFETDIQFEKSMRGKRHLSAAIGTVWLNSESSDTTPSFYISSHARFQLNGLLMYRSKKVSMALTAVYKERRPQAAPAINAHVSSAYFVTNLQLGYAIGKRLSLNAECDNVFDQQYSDLLGAKMPGRWFMGGIKFRFERKMDDSTSPKPSTLNLEPST